MQAERPCFTVSNFLDGSFADGVEKYLADRFPGRSVIIDRTRELRQLGSLATWEDYSRVAESDVQSLEVTEEMTEEDVPVTPRPTRTPAPTPEATPVPSAAEDAAAISTTAEPTATSRPTKAPADLNDYPRELWFYLMDGTTRYNAAFLLRDTLRTQCSLYDAYASVLPEGGKFVLTIAPHSTRSTRLKAFSDPKGMFSEIEPFIQAFTAENVSVVSAVDLLSEPVMAGEYVYFRTDSHWTPYGAHLVVSRMLEEVGEALPPYDAFPRTQEYPFLGTLYRNTHNALMKNNPDTLDIVTPTHPVEVRRYSAPDRYTEVPLIKTDAGSQDRYAVYLGGPNGSWTVVDRTDVPEDAVRKTCLLVSDSYGLCTVPFFIEVYDRVIVYDPRYFDRKAMGGVGDLIVSWNVGDAFMIVGDHEFYDTDRLFYLYANRQF